MRGNNYHLFDDIKFRRNFKKPHGCVYEKKTICFLIVEIDKILINQLLYYVNIASTSYQIICIRFSFNLTYQYLINKIGLWRKAIATI